MGYKDCTLNYWQKAEDFAASKGYDMVRFVMNENGHEIYNFLSKSMLGKKTGWPHYMDIDTNGDIIEVEDEDKIFFYRDEHCKQFERKKKSLSNIKDLTGKTIFDFATNDELADAGFPPDEEWYMDYLKERVRVINLFELADELKYKELKKQVKRQYPDIIDKYLKSFNE